MGFIIRLMQKYVISLILKMQKNLFFTIEKKIKNTESAQLCIGLCVTHRQRVRAEKPPVVLAPVAERNLRSVLKTF